MLPAGIELGLSPVLLVGLMAATYAYFFIPNYPSDIATVNFDVTGTTKIGKYYFNHSFMAPGLIGVFTACGWLPHCTSCYSLSSSNKKCGLKPHSYH